MKIAAIIQARTSSSRLPGKVLKKLPYDSDISVLEQVIRRIKESKFINEIIIATTQDIDDNQIVEIAEKENVKYFRGSLNNVLERYYKAAKENCVDIVVRITSDCPCIDFEIIDLLISEHLKNQNDYTSNTLKRTFFHGADAEVFNFKVLETAFINTENDFEREHVTPYIYKSNPDKFKIQSVESKSEPDISDIRLTLDTTEDYALLCTVFDYLYENNNFFLSKEILNLFKTKPWLKLINKKIIQKKIFNSLKEEIEEAINILDLQDLKRVKNLLADADKINENNLFNGR